MAALRAAICNALSGWWKHNIGIQVLWDLTTIARQPGETAASALKTVTNIQVLGHLLTNECTKAYLALYKRLMHINEMAFNLALGVIKLRVSSAIPQQQ